jgi:hypothetical protein
MGLLALLHILSCKSLFNSDSRDRNFILGFKFISNVVRGNLRISPLDNFGLIGI